VAKTQTLSFPIRLPDAMQAEALRLLDASTVAINQIVTDLWPQLDLFASDRTGSAWKEVERHLLTRSGHGSRQERCEMESAGRILIGANDDKVYAFALPQPMKVSPGILYFSGLAGGPSPLEQTVTLWNSGTSTLTWSAGSASQPWIAVTPSSGSLAAGISTSPTFSVNTIGLSAGTYSATVVLTPSIGLPITVVVRLTLT
jgi:Viral BACON domain